jgi:hypothetical protein
MLRSDNITCVTVMLDPPGPPFSDCVVKKKRERLNYSMSSCIIIYFIHFIHFYKYHFFSATSVCSDDTVELDHLSPTTSSPAMPQRSKPVLERKEHILTPISNGPTPVRVRVLEITMMTCFVEIKFMTNNKFLDTETSSIGRCIDIAC